MAISTKGITGETYYLRGFSNDDTTRLWGAVNALGLAGNVANLRGDLSNIYGEVDSDLSGDVSNIEGDVSGIWGDVSNLTGDVTDLTGFVGDISGDVTGISGNCNMFRGSIPTITAEQSSAGVAIALLAGIKAAPTVVVTPGAQSLSVAITPAEGDEPGTFEISIDGGETWVETDDDTSPAVVAIEYPAPAYSVIVRTVTDEVRSLWSAAHAVIGAPTIVVTPGTDSLSVAVTPAAGDTPDHFQYSTDTGVNWETWVDAVGPIVLSDLATGTEYTVMVRTVTDDVPSVATNNVEGVPE